MKSSIPDSLDPRTPSKSTLLIIKHAFFCMAFYLVVIVVIFLVSGSFKDNIIFKPVDVLYFAVTRWTIGFGDIVSLFTFTKLLLVFSYWLVLGL